MKDAITMKESELLAGIDLCLTKVQKLLDDAQVLIDNNKNNESAHALGLYTFAIEEYGKMLLLKDCLTKIQPNGDVIVPKWIFAQGDLKKVKPKPHFQKIQRAFGGLPEPCKNCQIGVVVDTATPSKKSRRVTTSHGTMVIIGSLTGLFSYSGPIDFNVRKQALYVDWDNDKNEWKLEMTSPNNSLKEAIKFFRKHLSKP